MITNILPLLFESSNFQWIYFITRYLNMKSVNLVIYFSTKNECFNYKICKSQVLESSPSCNLLVKTIFKKNYSVNEFFGLEMKSKNYILNFECPNRIMGALSQFYLLRIWRTSVFFVLLRDLSYAMKIRSEKTSVSTLKH